jgi:hypothetical protein
MAMQFASAAAFDEHCRKQAVAWACGTIAAAGWSLRVDPYNADGWEATRDDQCLVVSDWRDLCDFAKEVTDPGSAL